MTKQPKYRGSYSLGTYEAAAQIIDQEARTGESTNRCIRLATAMWEASETWLRDNPPAEKE